MNMISGPSGITPIPSHACETSIHERGITTAKKASISNAPARRNNQASNRRESMKLCASFQQSRRNEMFIETSSFKNPSSGGAKHNWPRQDYISLLRSFQFVHSTRRYEYCACNGASECFTKARRPPICPGAPQLPCLQSTCIERKASRLLPALPDRQSRATHQLARTTAVESRRTRTLDHKPRQRHP